MKANGTTPMQEQKEKFVDAEFEKILFPGIDVILTESAEESSESNESDTNVDWDAWQL